MFILFWSRFKSWNRFERQAKIHPHPIAMKDRLLYPQIKFQHRVRIQSRFSDYDAFRHVNNNAYMAYFDLGKSLFFNEVMGKPCSPAELSAAVVNVNVDFLAPSPIGEPLEVCTALVHLGERSFTLYQRIVDADTQSAKAQATSVLAGFDIATQCSAPLSPALAKALCGLLASL